VTGYLKTISTPLRSCLE